MENNKEHTIIQVIQIHICINKEAWIRVSDPVFKNETGSRSGFGFQNMVGLGSGSEKLIGVGSGLTSRFKIHPDLVFFRGSDWYPGVYRRLDPDPDFFPQGRDRVFLKVGSGSGAKYKSLRFQNPGLNRIQTYVYENKRKTSMVTIKDCSYTEK